MGTYSPLFDDAQYEHINRDFMFSMPCMKTEPAVIFGATRATALVAREAFRWGHKTFVVVGGKPVGFEMPMFTEFLIKNLEQANLPLPETDMMTEAEYGRQVLIDLGVDENNIKLLKGDKSTNFQQNLEVLKANSYHAHIAIDAYTLAGTARRVLATAENVWKGSDIVLAAHNVFPHGVYKDTWHKNTAAAMYAFGEAMKLPDYEKQGFCLPIDLDEKMRRVAAFAAQANAAPRSWATGYNRKP